MPSAEELILFIFFNNSLLNFHSCQNYIAEIHKKDGYLFTVQAQTNTVERHLSRTCLSEQENSANLVHPLAFPAAIATALTFLTY